MSADTAKDRMTKVKLTREVRFSIAPGLLDEPNYNSWAGWPSAGVVAPYLVLRCTVSGPLDSNSSYVCNIKLIDDLVRKSIIRPICSSPEKFRTAESILGFAQAELNDKIPDHLGIDQVDIKTTPYLSHTWNCENPGMILVTQQFEFSASHRLHNPKLSDEENRSLFGKCNHPNGHGHNYVIDITWRKASESEIPLVSLEAKVKELIVDRLDHKNLNEDIDVFKKLNPTVENITQTIFDWLDGYFDDATLHRVRVYETPKTWAEVSAQS